MKKNLRKVSALVLALFLLFSLSFFAFAADISKDQAIDIALGDAGYSASDVVYVNAKFDHDDGLRKWDVDFLVEEQGLYRDYDYEISAADGRILEKDWEYDNDYRENSVLSFEDKFEQFFAQIIAWLISLFSK